MGSTKVPANNYRFELSVNPCVWQNRVILCVCVGTRCDRKRRHIFWGFLGGFRGLRFVLSKLALKAPHVGFFFWAIKNDQLPLGRTEMKPFLSFDRQFSGVTFSICYPSRSPSFYLLLSLICSGNTHKMTAGEGLEIDIFALSFAPTACLCP